MFSYFYFTPFGRERKMVILPVARAESGGPRGCRRDWVVKLPSVSL
jgi:hypothetical protein